MTTTTTTSTNGNLWKGKNKEITLHAPKVVDIEIPEPEEDEDYLCPICREYPEHEVYQCIRGHIFCSKCYTGMIANKPECATCRARIDRSTPPIRNLIVEKKISQLPARCTHWAAGCHEQLTRGNVHDHEEKYCLYRSAECVAKSLGCTWQGVLLDLEKHQASCMLATFQPAFQSSMTRLSDQVSLLERAVDQRLSGLETRLWSCLDTEAKLRQKLSSRSEAIQRFEREILVPINTFTSQTTTFSAFDLLWELCAIPPAPGRTGLGITLKPVGGAGSDSAGGVGRYHITLRCIHPTNTYISTSFRYEGVSMSSQIYLRETCFLSGEQLRFFVNAMQNIQLILVMKKLP